METQNYNCKKCGLTITSVCSKCDKIVDVKLVIMAIILLLISCFVRAYRWKLLIDAADNIKLSKVFSATMVGYFGNGIFDTTAISFLYIGDIQFKSFWAYLTPVNKLHLFDSLWHFIPAVSFRLSWYSINSFITVSGVFVLRFLRPDIERPYKASLFPLPPLIYLSLTGWTLYFVIANRPMEVLFSAAVILSGIIFYFISAKSSQ